MNINELTEIEKKVLEMALLQCTLDCKKKAKRLYEYGYITVAKQQERFADIAWQLAHKINSTESNI